MNDYQKTSKNNLPTAAVSVGENNKPIIVGMGLGCSCEYVALPSTEYKRLRDTIEAQQQEIERLKDALKGSYIITKALTADKDEQAGRIMRMERVLKKARDVLGGWVLWDEIDALIGGKEDV